MARGRRKDTTLSPSRSLIVQRAYRDRKAKYVADLEDRCRRAEEENERLRKELEQARSESVGDSNNSELVKSTACKKGTESNFERLFLLKTHTP
jgi:predicted phage gp36 major capsid-like protein